jgi:hypothetical protein
MTSSGDCRLVVIIYTLPLVISASRFFGPSARGKGARESEPAIKIQKRKIQKRNLSSMAFSTLATLESGFAILHSAF